ncbi:type IV pilus modification PilV family protein [Halalkalibacillus halophilus]|uniref:type IV pilus modification PilV family protein n=1 Tax=Halalkalibacillus halophilus TaxID=392827 RepID=UPI000428F965|nr:prepilin-type N-terminal cleavage/methylation domain-containing protein [Halalkalibacillus halophilus]
MPTIKNRLKDSSGLTLIEVLGAITILSIVLIGFMNFFPQSMLLANKTEDELTAVNVAEDVLDQVKANGESSSVDSPISANNREYYPVVEYIQSNAHSEAEHTLSLQRVRIQIYTTTLSEGAVTPAAELYGYVETEEELDE